MIKDEFSNEEDFQEDSFDYTKPNIIEVSFLGEDIGHFNWDGKQIEIEYITRDSRLKNMMDDMYNETDFFDFRNDSINPTDAKDDLSAFLIKIQGMAIKYGISVQLIG